MTQKNKDQDFAKIKAIHDLRLEWVKAFSPIALIIVAAVTAYFGVDRHAHVLAENEQQLKKFELETDLRYKIINDYLSLPSDTSRNRIDYLTFIAKTDERKSVQDWANSRLELLKKERDDAVAYDDELRKSVLNRVSQNNLQTYGAIKQKGLKVLCSGTLHRAQGRPIKISLSRTFPPGYTENQARDFCRQFSDQQCADKGLEKSKCTSQFESVPLG